MTQSTKMYFGIKSPVLVFLLCCCYCCNGDPTLVLNSPIGAPGFGGVYGLGGAMHSPFLFDRDDVDLLFRAPAFGSPIMPAAAPIAQPPTVLVVDGQRPGHTVINNDISSPIPGVRYVVPDRLSSRRLSPYRRSRNYRRRFGYYG